MPSEEDRAKIDQWVAEAPDTRVVETNQSGSRWITHAIEDGEILYEETDFGDEPLLHLLAGWCSRQTKRLEARPPVKTGVWQKSLVSRDCSFAGAAFSCRVRAHVSQSPTGRRA